MTCALGGSCLESDAWNPIIGTHASVLGALALHVHFSDCFERSAIVLKRLLCDGATSSPTHLVQLNANELGLSGQHRPRLYDLLNIDATIGGLTAPGLARLRLGRAHYCTAPASSVEDKGASVHEYSAHYSAPASADIF